MTPFRTIAAATDFSPDGNCAVRRAARLAQQHGAWLTIVHIVDGSAPRPFRDRSAPSPTLATRFDQAQARLDGLAREVIGARDMQASVEVLTGDRFKVLMQVAEKNDLLVIGQRAKNPLFDLLRSHSAYRVAETSRRPVLVARRAAQSPYRRVLLPVDFTPSSDAAANVAFSVSRGTRLDVFHACEASIESRLRRAQVSPETIHQSIKAERRMLLDRVRRKLDDLGFDSEAAAISVGRGPAVASILEQVQTRGIDLIVTGRPRRSGLLGALIGNVGMRLLKESDCDVLIVPSPAFGAPSRFEMPACAASTTALLGNARLARHAAALAGASTEVELSLVSIQSEYRASLQQAGGDSNRSVNADITFQES